MLGRDAGGEPRYVGGMRGAVERDTMRYYLGIEAFLGALEAPRAQRTEKGRATGLRRPSATGASCTRWTSSSTSP